MKKRSVKVMGHDTSITLEEPFWKALKDLAEEQGLSVNQMVSDIDQSREMETGLSSAIRIYILNHYRSSKP